jgi:long-chain acyl-CoA synthetase
VIGVDDEETGEAVVAYVVASRTDSETVEDDVRRHCQQRLARFKRPTRIVVADELPLTVTGKVQKGRLRGIERRRALGILE